MNPRISSVKAIRFSRLSYVDSVAEPHHFYAVLAPVTDKKKLYAAPAAPAPIK
jgi:hypothetical protein